MEDSTLKQEYEIIFNNTQDALFLIEVTEENIEYEEELDLPGGKRYWKTSLTPVFNQGQITQIVGSSREITKEKLAQKRLKRLNRRFQIATQIAGVGVWEYNFATDELIWNEEMYKLYNLDQTETENNFQMWIERVHPGRITDYVDFRDNKKTGSN